MIYFLILICAEMWPGYHVDFQGYLYILCWSLLLRMLRWLEKLKASLMQFSTAEIRTLIELYITRAHSGVSAGNASGSGDLIRVYLCTPWLSDSGLNSISVNSLLGLFVEVIFLRIWIFVIWWNRWCSQSIILNSANPHKMTLYTPTGQRAVVLSVRPSSFTWNHVALVN